MNNAITEQSEKHGLIFRISGIFILLTFILGLMFASWLASPNMGMGIIAIGIIYVPLGIFSILLNLSYYRLSRKKYKPQNTIDLFFSILSLLTILLYGVSFFWFFIIPSLLQR